MAKVDDDSMLFPQKLMSILEDPRNHDAISWLPDGQAFVICNREMFAETVMPKYFSRKAKFSSFMRKLNRWNFLRIANGPKYGAYFHKFFLRDQPHLAAQMFCKNARTMFAMASNVAEKKPDAVELRMGDHTESVLKKQSVDLMSSSLLENGSISYGGGMTKICNSAPLAHVSLPYAMTLRSEEQSLNYLIVKRALQMRQQLCAPLMHPLDRQLQALQLVDVSMQPHQHKELHQPMMRQRKKGDGPLPRINRASAA